MDWVSFIAGGYIVPALAILVASIVAGAKHGVNASAIIAAFMFAVAWPVLILKLDMEPRA